jgi:hypothetical protein
VVTYLSVELVDIAGAQGRLRSTILLDYFIIFFKAIVYPLLHTCSNSLSSLTCFIGLLMHPSRLLYSCVYQVGVLFLVNILTC